MLPSEFAERLFNAYNEQGPNPWKTFDGRDVPRWPDLSEQVREKWTAVAIEADAERKRSVEAEIRNTDNCRKDASRMGEKVALAREALKEIERGPEIPVDAGPFFNPTPLNLAKAAASHGQSVARATLEKLAD
jgi:hypothetical protein